MKKLPLMPLLMIPLLMLPLAAQERSAWESLMPMPRSIEVAEGGFRLDAEFRVAVGDSPGPRLSAEASRFLRRLDNRAGLFLSQDYVEPSSSSASVGLSIIAARRGKLRLGEDESYRLTVGGDAIRIDAATDIGAIRALETLLQLLSADEDGFYFPALTIEDEPRFAWRGLMIDSARHFMPMDALKRNLDGMAAVKLNVLHWHLTDDQGFRVESRRYPRLHELGADGLYYTQEQVKEVIAYAAQRGIRVYPEFDVPGHATAWLVGHPELGSIPGPYRIERGWGIFDPTLDPTNEQTYELLDGLFTEMAALFTDEYFHIGGDEVSGKHWEESAGIRAFMEERGIEDLHELQSHFNQRVLKILSKSGKKMVGWDEILQPDMPTNIVIHSWRGRDAMVSAAKDGYQSILSNGYYIDLMQPASFHYQNDPLPANIALSVEERARVLGGEATMWSEHVTVETVDSRIWPRTAAIAERLWSPQSVDNIDDMYRRLDTIALQLEELGLTHIKNRAMMMRRLARGYDYAPIETLADVVEPLKLYQRNADLIYTSHSPYTLLPDVAVADAKDARRFNGAVERFLSSGDSVALAELRGYLTRWEANHERLAALATAAPAIREALPLSEALEALARLGSEALDRLAASSDEGTAWSLQPGPTLEQARQPVARVELQIVDAIERLVRKAQN